jgi:hypothetical protein
MVRSGGKEEKSKRGKRKARRKKEGNLRAF